MVRSRFSSMELNIGSLLRNVMHEALAEASDVQDIENQILR